MPDRRIRAGGDTPHLAKDLMHAVDSSRTIVFNYAEALKTKAASARQPAETARPSPYKSP